MIDNILLKVATVFAILIAWLLVFNLFCDRKEAQYEKEIAKIEARMLQSEQNKTREKEALHSWAKERYEQYLASKSEADKVRNYFNTVKETVLIPNQYGRVHTYMGWQNIKDPTTKQYALREAYGMNFDEQGFARIGSCYVVACTSTFGEVGDLIVVEKDNGEEFAAIIGDIKNPNDAGCNEYGHQNGYCIIEFIVDRTTWYGTEKSVYEFHPEWNSPIKEVRRYQSVLSSDEDKP